ncbi:Gfo/Idh/MocA family oxidoreductase [Catenuloplanes japonicus]|uniref:Gfo/Idh/MocA family oxidoreductase n=1 Tax=Catenuloplanes japonicus TaxID=33876 RepID=UPI0005271B62|nr:Gfo/Idh/MocA family oxidoreductase [Catenuloplanes japonicus]
MLRTVIVGLGRSGTGLHLPAIHKIHPGYDEPVLGLDPRAPRHLPGVTVCADPADAAARTDPARTVVHVCTPPGVRARVLRDLAPHGFTRFLVEKPLADDAAGLDALLHTAERLRLRIEPVSQWLSSALTRRIATRIAADGPGALREIRLVQRKPRFARSLTDSGHATAFDVEVPHALGVALALAGPGHVHHAGWSDLRTDTAVRPRLGRAWMTVRHDTGVRTRIESCLSAPLRERRIEIGLRRTTLTGFYPCSEADSYARLTTRDGPHRQDSTFEDDSLTTAIREAYDRFAADPPGGDDPASDALVINTAVVRMLADAKRLAGTTS